MSKLFKNVSSSTRNLNGMSTDDALKIGGVVVVALATAAIAAPAMNGLKAVSQGVCNTAVKAAKQGLDEISNNAGAPTQTPPAAPPATPANPQNPPTLTI